MMSADAQQTVLRLLEKNGQRLTAQKRTVLKVLFEFDRAHMTVEEIYECAKRQSSRISIATVYRVISLLEQAKVVRRLRTEDNRSCFELIHGDEPEGHPHCICTNCGKTFGVVDDAVIRMLSACEDQIRACYDFKIHSKSILYYGLCEACRGNSEPR